jgi:hypothetical protein
LKVALQTCVQKMFANVNRGISTVKRVKTGGEDPNGVSKILVSYFVIIDNLD